MGTHQHYRQRDDLLRGRKDDHRGGRTGLAAGGDAEERGCVIRRGDRFSQSPDGEPLGRSTTLAGKFESTERQCRGESVGGKIRSRAEYAGRPSTSFSERAGRPASEARGSTEDTQ